MNETNRYTSQQNVDVVYEYARIRKDAFGNSSGNRVVSVERFLLLYIVCFILAYNIYIYIINLQGGSDRFMKEKQGIQTMIYI